MTKPRNIDDILDELVTLPTLPSSVERVVQLVNDPDSSLAEVGKAISADPSLALKTLRLVNSAYYGIRTQVVSVDHAVTMLGIKVIKNLALSATVFDTFKGGADQLLRHSITCAMAMRALVDAAGPQCPVEAEEAFVYGLLHDIGKIVFAEYLPDETRQAVERSRQEGISMAQAEQAVIGADHAEMGQRLAQNWKLPASLVQAIAGHHDLGRCADPESRTLASVLAIADYVCYASAVPSHEGCFAAVSEEVVAASKLSSNQMPRALTAFFDSLSGVDELMALAENQ